MDAPKSENERIHERWADAVEWAAVWISIAMVLSSLAQHPFLIRKVFGL